MANATNVIDVEAGEVVYTCDSGLKFSDGSNTKIVSCACKNDQWWNIGVNWGQIGSCTLGMDHSCLADLAADIAIQ